VAGSLLAPFEDQGVTYRRVAVDDLESEDLLSHFDSCHDWIHSSLKDSTDSNSALLIHCAAGVSRSAAVTIAYLMKSRKWSFKVRNYSQIVVCALMVVDLRVESAKAHTEAEALY